jgi:hypothetical protein
MQQDTLARKLQSATVYIETLTEVYQSQVTLGQRKVPPLELVQALQEVVDLLKEIRREVLLQELTRILHNGDLPEVVRNETVGKIFKSLA